MIIFRLLNLRAAELHGDLTMVKRLESLQSFRDGEVKKMTSEEKKGGR